VHNVTPGYARTRKEITVKVPTTLLATAFALAALVLPALPATQPAHAAPIESGTTHVYGIDPAKPTVPSVPGPGLFYHPDMKVTLKSVNAQNGYVTWTFRAENVGNAPATRVNMAKLVIRHQPGKDGDEWEPPIRSQWLYVTPGASKDFTISCSPKPGHLPCSHATLFAYVDTLYETDPNPSNDSASGWAY
jgi:hypothetical protein